MHARENFSPRGNLSVTPNSNTRFTVTRLCQKVLSQTEMTFDCPSHHSRLNDEYRFRVGESLLRLASPCIDSGTPHSMHHGVVCGGILYAPLPCS
jgi:hypothetical protein